MILPKIYLDFVEMCSKSLPLSLVGTDFAFTSSELRSAALEMLSENLVESFLSEDDFVFFSHQGYVFGYFEANGNPDPMVYTLSEIDLQKKNMGLLSLYIKNLL